MRRLLLLLLLALAGATAWLFVLPPEDDPGRADAIVVLAGDPEQRVPAGLRLLEAGAARTLVLSADGEPDFPRKLCRRENVVCFEARPYSTTGEAETFARLARRRGWDETIVVTSRYHVMRARMVFRRCVPGEVRAVGARADLVDYAQGTVWEWPKLAHALLVKRDC